MRFKAQIYNTNTFVKLVASLASLGNVAWVRLSDEDVRFTIIPEHGSQVWAVLSIDTIFESYTIASAAESSTINLEVPLQPLLRALRSAANASTVAIRLTKRDGVPSLCITITTTGVGRHGAGALAAGGGGAAEFGAEGEEGVPPVLLEHHNNNNNNNTNGTDRRPGPGPNTAATAAAPAAHRAPDRETTITQHIAIRVLSLDAVSNLHEPRARTPEVHIIFPSLVTLKALSDRFTRLSALSSGAGGGMGTSSDITSTAGPTSTTAAANQGAKAARLTIAASMHGELAFSLATPHVTITSAWTGQDNPAMDAAALEEGGGEAHPSEVMRRKGANDESRWARVRIDARDWGRVLSVGRMGTAIRVVGCFCHEHALILYVYLPNEDSGAEASVLTYYISSYSV